jgi:hypothetical protein
MTRLTLTKYVIATAAVFGLGGMLAHVLAAGTTYGLTSTLADQGTISGQVDWSVTVSPQPYKVQFWIDGVESPNVEMGAPYTYNGDGSLLDTTKLSNGVHTFQEVAIFDTGGVTVTDPSIVNNGAVWTATHKVNVSNTAAAPTVSLSANPTSVSSGGSSTLTWSSANATSCTASGGWTGTKATAGSLAVTNITQATTYTLTCTGNGSAVASTVVSINSSGGITHPANGLGLDTAGKYVTDYSNVGSYGLVITSAQGAPQAKPLSALTLIYSDGSQIVTFYTEGLSYSIASANGCLLTQFATGRYVFDHTKATCNQLMADADVAYVKQVGLKGLFLDDTVPRNPYGVVTPTGWEQGMVSFVHLLHQELNANSLYLLTNANAFEDSSLGNGDNGAGDVNWAKQLAPDGVMEESWMETRDGNNVLRASGANWNQNWDGWQSAAKQIQAAGIDFVGLSYNLNTSYVPYTYASTLLANTGRAVYMPAHTDGSDPWSSIFNTNLGAATTATTQSGLGWYREYTGGQAIVNPSPTSSTTINNQTLQLTTGYIGP